MTLNRSQLAAETLNKTPEILKKKKDQIAKLQIEIQNYINFVKAGDFSKAIADALDDSEKKSEEFKREIESLEFQQQNNFKAPPKEWIQHRLENLRETFSKDTVLSSLALKELLGTILLEPVLFGLLPLI